jgi:hypothetical protein
LTINNLFDTITSSRKKERAGVMKNLAFLNKELSELGAVKTPIVEIKKNAQKERYFIYR